RDHAYGLLHQRLDDARLLLCAGRRPGNSSLTEELPMPTRELRPLGKTLGTEALGIDLSKPLDAETFAWIENAFAEHPVLVFRDQDLGAGELAAFGRRFGKPKIHSLVDYRHAEYPEVSWVTNVHEEGNTGWLEVNRPTDGHPDSPRAEVPPRLANPPAEAAPPAPRGT